jgi:hypothetical protein
MPSLHKPDALRPVINARVFFIGDCIFGLSGGLLRELQIRGAANTALREADLL